MKIVYHKLTKSSFYLRIVPNYRLQAKSEKGIAGLFIKVSGANATGQAGLGNDEFAAAIKGVGDFLVGTGQFGVYDGTDGFGFGAEAKAAVLSGRATAVVEIRGWEIEVGVQGDLIAYGAYAKAVYSPDEGFEAKVGASPGAGGGFLLRVKPKQ